MEERKKPSTHRCHCEHHVNLHWDVIGTVFGQGALHFHSIMQSPAPSASIFPKRNHSGEMQSPSLPWSQTPQDTTSTCDGFHCPGKWNKWTPKVFVLWFGLLASSSFIHRQLAPEFPSHVSLNDVPWYVRTPSGSSILSGFPSGHHHRSAIVGGSGVQHVSTLMFSFLWAFAHHLCG